MRRILVLFLRWVHDYLHRLDAEDQRAYDEAHGVVVSEPLTAGKPWASPWYPAPEGTGSPYPPQFTIIATPSEVPDWQYPTTTQPPANT
jgi:hypothetical protein